MDYRPLRDNSIIIKVKDTLSETKINERDLATVLGVSEKELYSDLGIDVVRHYCGWSTICTFKPLNFIMKVMDRHEMFKDHDRKWFDIHRWHLYNKTIELFVKDVRAITGISFSSFESLYLKDKGYVYLLDPVCGDLLVKMPFEFRVTGPIIDRLDDMSSQFS